MSGLLSEIGRLYMGFKKEGMEIRYLQCLSYTIGTFQERGRRVEGVGWWIVHDQFD